MVFQSDESKLNALQPHNNWLAYRFSIELINVYVHGCSVKKL